GRGWSRDPAHAWGVGGHGRRYGRGWCVSRPLGGPARHLSSVWNRSRRARIVGIADKRTAFTQGRYLERKLRAAHSRAFDRADLHNTRAELDRPRFHALDLGLVPPRRTLAVHEAPPATGERQQHAGTDEVDTHATLHARKNRSVSLTGLQRLPNAIPLRIRNSCQSGLVALNCAPA